MTAKGSCLYQGAARYHGDIWNGTGCEFCACSRGQVLCQRAECARLECPQVSSDRRGGEGSVEMFSPQITQETSRKSQHRKLNLLLRLPAAE